MTSQVLNAHSAGYAVHLQRLQQLSTARPSRSPIGSLTETSVCTIAHRSAISRHQHLTCPATLTAEAATAPAVRSARGHADLLHGLGEVGDVAPTLMPWLLRLAHIRQAPSSINMLQRNTCDQHLLKGTTLQVHGPRWRLQCSLA